MRQAFAHRRKSLARSLELAQPGRIEAVREALEAIGVPAGARAQELSPRQFEQLARRCGEPGHAAAPAKLNLCLFVGPTREDGLHEIGSIFEPLELADELTVTEWEGPGDEVVCPEIPGPNLVEKGLAFLREQGWESPPIRVEIEKRVPIAAGLGRRQRRRRRGTAPGARRARGPARPRGLGRAPTCRRRSSRAPASSRARARSSSRFRGPAAHGVVLIPQTAGLTTPRSTPRPTGSARTAARPSSK